jgi:hypothetical protein
LKEETMTTILSLLEDLDAVEILRAHTPPHRLYLLDRLEIALRVADERDDYEADDAA